MASAAKKKAVCLRPFYDIKEKVNRKAGEAFECTPARLKEIAEAYPTDPLVEEQGAEAKGAKEPDPTEAA